MDLTAESDLWQNKCFLYTDENWHSEIQNKIHKQFDIVYKFKRNLPQVHKEVKYCDQTLINH